MADNRDQPSRHDLQRYRENWQEEIDSAAQYHAMAANEKDLKVRKIYEDLALVEERHITFWEQRLKSAGQKVSARRPSWRSRILIQLAKTFGPRVVLPTVAASEQAGRNAYAFQRETKQTGMAAQERSHARLLRVLIRNEPQGVSGSTLAQLEGRHKSVGGNALRAAVLGANDGLCSNLSLVMGVAGAAVDSKYILITGVAGLLAGASSMALGEWVSVKSSRELAEREIAIEASELEHDPEGEAKELQLIYEAKGMSEDEAIKLSQQMLNDKSTALDTLTREELGIDPADLGGSPLEAAIVSFVLFSVGAIVPVIPFFVFARDTAVIYSIVFSGIALFLIGAAITIFTGRSVFLTGTRQLLLGLTAAMITYALGRWLGFAGHEF